jgi:hypothetical protein
MSLKLLITSPREKDGLIKSYECVVTIICSASLRSGFDLPGPYVLFLS